MKKIKLHPVYNGHNDTLAIFGGDWSEEECLSSYYSYYYNAPFDLGGGISSRGISNHWRR